MNSKNTKDLCDTFPVLYQGREASISENLMPFGFEHSNGWFGIIWELSDQLSKLDVIPIASQVKEKFGTLRFYIYGGSDEAYKLIDLAEAKSARTCEICGAAAKTRGNGWVVTYCDGCHQEWVERRHGPITE